MKLKYFLLIFLLIPGISHAQVLTNNSGSVTLTAGGKLTVKGDVLNQGTGTFTNNGTIDLNGNWVNNATNNCFGTTQGTVILNGGNQSIGGSNSTTFNNLELQGTGSKSLFINTTTGGGNATPTGVLTLNDLPLILKSNTLTVTNPSPGAITRTTGFIESETNPLAGYGIVQWNTGTVSAGNNFIFPFGTTATGSYLPVSFQVTSGGTGTSGFISVATYPTVTSATPNNRPLPTGLTSLMNAATGLDNAPNVVDRFWVVDVQNFTTKPVTTLSFSYRDSEWDLSGGSTNTISEAQLQAQFNNGSVWSFPPTGVVNTVSNTVTVSGVNTYNNFWTLVGSSDPLPVELLNFDAHPVANKIVECDWITASEINNDYFVVEKSKDGIAFAEAGTVPGAGNSSQMLAYKFSDVEPFTGLSYYRLRQVDYDGSISYSRIVPVTINPNHQPVSLFPNPASSFISVSFMNDSEEPFELQFLDMNGKLCLYKEIQSARGVNNLILDVSQFADGIYLMKLTSQREVFTTKWVKQGAE